MTKNLQKIMLECLHLTPDEKQEFLTDPPFFIKRHMNIMCLKGIFGGMIVGAFITVLIKI